MRKEILISFSGGETSAMMLYLMLKKYGRNPDYEIVTVFANTGLEHEKTLEFCDKIDKYFDANIIWVEAVVNPTHGVGVRHKIVDFETASRSGEPFESAIQKYGIPNPASAHCTQHLKSIPISSVAKSVFRGGYQTAIGIRIDEPQRINFEKAKQKRFIYPLVTEFPVTKKQVNSFWSKMPFRLGIPSYLGNCTSCFKKGLRVNLTAYLENPEGFEKFREWEVKYGHFVPENRLTLSQEKGKELKLPFRFFRDNMTVAEIAEEAHFCSKKRLTKDSTFKHN